MKILCTSQVGSSSIVGPTIRVMAIAKELQRRGAEIRFVANQKLRRILEDNQIKILPLPDMPETTAESFQMTLMAEKEIIANEKPDLILSGSFVSLFSAQNAGIPIVLITLQPHGQKTVELFQKMMAGGGANDGLFSNIGNFFAQFTSGAGFEHSIREIANALVLIFVEGMSEISADVDYERMFKNSGNLEGLFQKLKPKIGFTGPLLTEKPGDFPDQEKLKFLYTGKPNQPLVYITIGGGTALIGEEFLYLAMEAFRSLPDVNVVISTGLAISKEQIAGYQHPENVTLYQFVPGIELIKASDVTVFHGGSSTLMTCIACGKPGVVIPSMDEQEDNGKVLSGNGAGILLDKQGLTPEILAGAVRKILDNDSFRQQAEKLKTLGEKYGGARGAAFMIEKIMEERRLAHAGSRLGCW